MQIILLESIDKLGKIGSTVEVADGYGRNYLLPRKKAIRATKENLVFYKQQKDIIEKENIDKRDSASHLASNIEGLSVTVVRQAADDGRLYGSVNARDISEAIKKVSNIDVPHDQIIINSKFKQIGVYDVFIQLHGEVRAKVILNISRNFQENTPEEIV